VEDAPKPGGARFIFSLPENTQATARDNLEAMVGATVFKIPPQKILIVDDEVELAATLADILQPDGHHTVQVENGARALEELKKQDFDVIISDLRMPVLDGPGLYRALEKDMPRYLTRIIFVTGDTLSVPVREFLSSTALDVIEKPYTPDDLRRALAAIVRDNKTGGKTKTKEETARI
jgi:CheY-like chemotaxis protein